MFRKVEKNFNVKQLLDERIEVTIKSNFDNLSVLHKCHAIGKIIWGLDVDQGDLRHLASFYLIPENPWLEMEGRPGVSSAYGRLPMVSCVLPPREGRSIAP